MSKGSRFVLAIFWANVVFGLLWQPLWLLMISMYKVCLEKNYANSIKDRDVFYNKQGYSSMVDSGIGRNEQSASSSKNSANYNSNDDENDEKKENDNYQFKRSKSEEENVQAAYLAMEILDKDQNNS